jgi:hypothetical protein
MIHIRRATLHDAALLRAMICELAEFEREPDLVTIREEDLVRDGFGANPRFRALIGEWDAEPAGYALFFDYYSTWAGRGLFLEDLFVRNYFASVGLEKRCCPRWRGLRSRNTVTEYTGKCSTGIKKRLNSTLR